MTAGLAELEPDLRAALTLEAAHLSELQAEGLLDLSEVRRGISAVHPLVFAAIYLAHHMPDATFADMHLDMYDLAAREWTQPNGLKQGRHAVIAPRECGKTTVAYTVLPLWAAAHGHAKFIAAFSDTAGQAHRHLNTFKRELESNELLRADYPELCSPQRRPGGVTVSDRQDEYAAKSGFRFVAMGIDGPASGLKDGAKRPDLILLDDIEGGAGTYTLYEATKRLETLRNTIFYLNLAARVLITGTTTLNGGLIHQLVQEKESWVESEAVNVHYYPALYRDSAGHERSTWPAKWSVEWLKEERDRNPREFGRNLMNQPMPVSSEYWVPTDFRYGALAHPSRRVISIDPAVTTRRSSDETAVAVVSYSAAERKSCVDEVVGLRVKGEPLRQHVLRLLERYPDINLVLFERNQGGEMMADSVLHSMPCEVRTVHASEKKELRTERLLNYYRRGVVLHAERFHELETEMQEFPNGLHDDLIDAVSQAVDHFAAVPAPTRLRSTVR